MNFECLHFLIAGDDRFERESMNDAGNNDAANEGYRPFSRGAIAAVITINSGALIASLSQFETLQELPNQYALFLAFSLWIGGVTLGSLTWGAAAMAAQAFATDRQKKEEWFAGLGILLFFVSVACFAIGSTLVTLALFGAGQQ